MKVQRWGRNLAVRIPSGVAKALNLEVGDEISIRAALDPATRRSMLATLRKFRGRLPNDFHFDRTEAHSR